MTVKGTNDFYPEQKEVQDKVFKAWREVSNNYGFKEVDIPVLETMKTLTAKSGDEVRDQIFVLEKRSKEEIGLRFDLTIGMTRMFVAKQIELQKPVKWFTIDKNWRYEAPQKGREREFFQLSVESFGSEKAEATAELINLCIATMNKLGLTKKDFFIRINNRKLLEGLLLDAIPATKFADVTRIIDKSEKISKDAFEEELLKLGLEGEQIKKIEKIIALKGKPSEVLEQLKEVKMSDEAAIGRDEIRKISEMVDNEYLEMDLSVARGLAYYTGTVFECFDRDKELRSLAGGGRYDNLVELLGGRSAPATGFAIGFSTLSLLLEKKGLLPKADSRLDYFICPINEEVMQAAMDLATKLRLKNKVDLDLMGRKLNKQLQYANKIGAKKAVIIGSQELVDGDVTVKDLETGKENKVKIESLS